MYQHVIEVHERVILDQFYPNNIDDGRLVTGLTEEWVRILKTPNLNAICDCLINLKNNWGVEELAVCLMHSYTFADHELAIGKLAEEIRFAQISLSSQVMPMVKMVPR